VVQELVGICGLAAEFTEQIVAGVPSRVDGTPRKQVAHVAEASP
jgi:hypothetical protein